MSAAAWLTPPLRREPPLLPPPQRDARVYRGGLANICPAQRDKTGPMGPDEVFTVVLLFECHPQVLPGADDEF